MKYFNTSLARAPPTISGGFGTLFAHHGFYRQCKQYLPLEQVKGDFRVV